jgi:hypothetical protein
MNVDVMVLALLALADAFLMVHLRRRHSQHLRMDRMMRSLQTHIRSQLAPQLVVTPARRRMTLRAS